METKSNPKSDSPASDSGAEPSQLQADGLVLVATAAGKGLATFRQRRDGSTEYVEGEAERIEYDSRTEKARLFNRAKVSSGGDQVSGHYIEYDAITENYLATNAPGSRQGAPAGRVRAVIQPKSDGQPSGGQ